MTDRDRIDRLERVLRLLIWALNPWIGAEARRSMLALLDKEPSTKHTETEALT